MSGYKGPRGPNVSQYIANLNQLSPVTEALAEPQPTSDDFSAFLNTDFFDINGGTNVDLTAPIDFGVDFDIKSSAQPTAENSPRPSFSAPSTKPGMDFNLNGEFAFHFILFYFIKRACRCVVLHPTLFCPSSSSTMVSSFAL